MSNAQGRLVLLVSHVHQTFQCPPVLYCVKTPTPSPGAGVHRPVRIHVDQHGLRGRRRCSLLLPSRVVEASPSSRRHRPSCPRCPASAPFCTTQPTASETRPGPREPRSARTTKPTCRPPRAKLHPEASAATAQRRPPPHRARRRRRAIRRGIRPRVVAAAAALVRARSGDRRCWAARRGEPRRRMP